MTNAVGGTAPSAAIVPPHSGSQSAVSGKAGAKRAAPDEDKLQDIPHATERGEEASGQAAATKVSKPSRQERDGHKKNDEEDASFQATIESMNSAGSQAPAAGTAQAAEWNAALALGQMTLDRPKTTGSLRADGTDTAPSDRRDAVAILPKQGSASALLLARQRLLAGDALANAKIDADTNAAPPDGNIVVINARVRSQEAHWSFPGTEAAMSARTTDAAIKISAAAAAASTKHGVSDVATTNSLPKPVGVEATSPDVTRDAQNQQSFGEEREGGAEGGRRDQTQNTAKARASVETVAPKSVDKSAANKSVTPPISNVTQQVGTSVLHALNDDSGEVLQTNAAPSLQSRPTIAGQVLRTIDLTLSPADLGSVNLRLSLKSNVLTIEAEASKASTAKLLNDDRDTLEKNLRDAGYDVSSLKITGAAAAGATATTAPSSAGMPFQGGSQNGPSFAQRQDGSPQQRDGSTSDQPRERSRGNNPQNPAATEAVSSRQANAIYI
jgi:hypothetical protein